MYTRFIIILAMLIFVLTEACHKNQNKIKNDQDIIAYINDQPIYYNDVDEIVKQQLYDELNRIYIIRKTALSEVINDGLLKSEAAKRKITSEQLIENHFNCYYSDSLLSAFINRNGLKSGVIEIKRGINSYDIQTPQGKKILDREIRRYIKQILIDSLTNVNKISILLEMPINPVFQTTDLQIYYRGNLESSVAFIEISDFECDACRSGSPLFSQLYEKYKDKVKFGFTNFSSYVTLSALASESAAKQNKFWEFHDSIYKMKVLPDTQDIFDLAQKLSLDVSNFKSDFYSNSLKDSIWKNIQIIDKYGIYGTPTILINNRLIFNSKSLNEIEEILKAEIDKNSKKF